MKSLDFHRYGDILVSGSMDTTVKLWDIRRKGCIITYSVSAGGAGAGSAGGAGQGRGVVTAGRVTVLSP